MKEKLEKEKLMEKEFLHGLMEEYTQENSQLDI
jgi:hypothetical protein